LVDVPDFVPKTRLIISQELLPVTEAQSRILTSELLHPGTNQYTLRGSLRFNNVSADALHQAVLDLLEKDQDINLRFQVADDGLTILRWQSQAVSEQVRWVEDENELRQRTDFERPFLDLFDTPLYSFFVSRSEPILYLKIHHVLTDGTGMFFLAKLLEKSLENTLELRPTLYNDYAQAEQNYLASEAYRRDAGYWADLLTGQLAGLSEFPDSLLKDNSASETYVWNLPPDLVNSVQEYREQLGFATTVFRLTAALIGIYLLRRHNVDAVPLLTASSGRTGLPQNITESLGIMVNTLPLILARGSREQTFAEFLKTTNTEIGQSLKHGRFPFNHLIRTLAEKGEDVAKLRNFYVVSNSIIDTDFEAMSEPEHDSSFGLLLRVNPQCRDAQGLQRIDLIYRKEIYSNRDIRFIVSGIESLIRDILNNSETPISRLSILGDEERQLLDGFQCERPDYDRNFGFIDFFRRSAAQYPDRPALVDEKETLNYRDVDQITDHLAALFEQRCSVRKRFVGLALSRRNAFMLSVIAVMKAGGAYLPLDPTYPPDRLEYMLADSEAALLITEKNAGISFGQNNSVPIWDIDEILNEMSSNNSAPLTLPSPSSEDPAYLMYTSGSTGRPKGAVIPHGAFAAFLNWNIDVFEMGPETRAAVIASFSFDASVKNLFPALCVGGSVHTIAEKMRFDPGAFCRYATEHGITDTSFPTQLGLEALRQYAFSIRNIALGGEKMSFIPPHTGRLFNVYGPTEFTDVSTVHRLEKDREYKKVPIGKPVSGARHYIVDRNLQLVPFGQPGELCLSGPQLGLGYWKKEELTRKAFVPNPHADGDDTQLLYRTGDLCCWNERGEIECLGRFDDQVKVRGFRIELGEIDRVLLTQQKLTAVATVVRGDRLATFYVAENDIDEALLRSFLAQTLPDYMIPSVFKRLDSMPMTPSGKIDRKKLPQIEMIAVSTKVATTDLQRLIIRIAAEVIDCSSEKLGVDASLLNAGMSSLAAIKIAARLANETGKPLGGQDVLQANTVEGIEILLNGMAESLLTESIAIEKRNEYPLSQSQLGIYLHCAKDPQATLYNMPLSLTFEKEIDAERLRRAWLAVVAAHPTLKTCFAMRERELVQVRDDDRELELEIKNVTESEVPAICESFPRPFNLFEGPLFRAAIYTSESQIHLLLDFHHLVFDGASLDIFLRELAGAYNGCIPEPEEFSAFENALLERQREGTAAYQQSADFFKERLTGIEDTTGIPRDRNTETLDAPMGIATFHVAKESVRNFCRSGELTPAGFFLGTLTMLLSGFVNRKDLLIFAISLGRDEPKKQRTLGMLVKTLPLAFDIEPDCSVSQHLRYAQRRLFETLKHQDYPFTKLSEEYRLKPEIMFAFQAGLFGSNYEFDGVAPKVGRLGKQPAKFPLSIHINEEPDAYHLEFQYNASLYESETMETLGSSLADLTKRLAISEGDESVRNTRITTSEQLKSIEGFNPPIVENAEPNLFSIFETKTQEFPNKTALIATDRELSFEELNREANRLAHGLLDRGIKRGDRVAFLLPRDSRVLVAMLGILKAGGAYIPIDPEYPAARIEQILADSNARLVLADTNRSDISGAVNFDDVRNESKTDNPGLTIGPDDWAYLIYTSGSTGKPKGVVLTHRGIVNYIVPKKGNRHVLALLEQDCRMLSVTTVSFDMFLKEALTVLMNGLTLVLADGEQARSPSKLAELFKTTGANAFNATPSRIAQYLEDPAFTEAISACRVLMAGGEAYPPALYRRLRELVPNAVLINTYGPTEITVSSNGKILDNEFVTIGAPLLNVVETVRDFCGRELPIGVVGELLIGGEGVAKGYYGLDELTRERFVTLGNRRYYKSGDRAKWNRRGEIVILGRGDRQVKLRGLRIELTEIESALRSLPGISEAVVLVQKIDDREHLVAWYLPELRREIPKPSLIRDELAAILPTYMLPTAWSVLESIPTTINGKINYEKLPTPQLLERGEYVAAENEIEEAFQRIFQEVLKLDRVGVLDNFFDLGGSSLLVTRILSEAQVKGYSLNYGEVFQKPTPRQLAELVQSRLEQKESVSPAIAAVDSPKRSSDGFDYGPIDELLAANTLESFRAEPLQPIGNIGLTGATGFLGIHLLKAFLDNESGAAYCLVRGKDEKTAKSRLQNMMAYYFGDRFEKWFESRIVVVNGDLGDTVSLKRLSEMPMETVFNCAANVKHFSAGTDIEDVNVGGVAALLKLCQGQGSRLVHISTTSIAGLSIENSPPESTLLSERMFWIGQNLENQYAGSKFRAERLLLAAMSGPDRIPVKIMRVGNLMGRHSDGEFQINSKTNSFVGRFRAFHQIGCISYDVLSLPTEFAPIDSTAEAVLWLAQTPAACCVFHPYNDHSIFMGDVVDAMNRAGLTIRPVESDEFNREFRAALRDERKAAQLASIIAYTNQVQGRRAASLKTENHYTSQILRRLDFHWPITSDSYLDTFIQGLETLGFFEIH